MAVKHMNIREFREKGFLQEANRLFFHPLGLALEIDVDEDGTERLGGVWDYREDPEGIYFADRLDAEKAQHVALERRAHFDTRRKLFADTPRVPFGDSHADVPAEGEDIQPLDWRYAHSDARTH